MIGPRFPDLISRLPATVPFVGPEEHERAAGIRFRARLGANENVFGPSPRALEALHSADAEIWKYADPSHFDLKAELSARLGCTPANIVFGEGIDGCLGYLVRLLVEPGDAVVTSDGAYPTFSYHVNAYGGALHKVPYRDDAEDLDALSAAARNRGARLVYLANPDNPMGSWHQGPAIRAMLDDLPDSALLILDEAYIEFAPDSAIPQIAADDPRVIRMRTFSKAYGLAGARIGYAIGHPDLIAGFERIRNHFGVNRMAQAGALAALRDSAWLSDIRHQVGKARDRLAAIAAANGMTALPSATNFVAVDTGRDGAFSRRLVAALERQGVFVRMPGVPPLDRCIRISCAPAPELDILAEALPRALAGL